MQLCCEGPGFTRIQGDECDKGAHQSYLGPEGNTSVIPHWFQPCECCCCLCYLGEYLGLGTLISYNWTQVLEACDSLKLLSIYFDLCVRFLMIHVRFIYSTSSTHPPLPLFQMKVLGLFRKKDDKTLCAYPFSCTTKHKYGPRLFRQLHTAFKGRFIHIWANRDNGHSRVTVNSGKYIWPTFHR